MPFLLPQSPFPISLKGESLVNDSSQMSGTLTKQALAPKFLSKYNQQIYNMLQLQIYTSAYIRSNSERISALCRLRLSSDFLSSSHPLALT